MNTNFITIKAKEGEFDFGVNGSIANLSYEQMNNLRAMTMVAIGTAEDMWRRAQEQKQENKAMQAHDN